MGEKVAEETLGESMTAETVEENMTEETVEENKTEETVAKNSETDFMLAHQAVFVYLTYFSLFCGWALPGFSRGPDDRIPGYIWFFYAAFQVIGIAIWTTVVIATIQYSNSQVRIRLNLYMLGMHLISCLGVFIWYCLTALYVYRDSLNHIVRFLK
ncbi:predicted protein [Meyerozyma guilliermondii ATCC 6260]|uniref:Transmembrane protein n=1 Tax=Meyerozyma guilliermondii (strain ATCC 6260 / CBS 566 / DSM 6381 / JCM 1539 / NBRC 10279 / NRRL Y-324) TaxID=294746 RepID=A5DMW2_PICGU|nr:uncharacterized protein PGUG_04613 [Meyerozyma guilliermondii ATCC 6260]EDK40515.2 predicted protein [Meyerozyma guilliermondii ATCC 6260]